MDGEQLGYTAGIARLRWAAVVRMDDLGPASTHRAGDRAGQSVGKQEARVGSRRLIDASLLVTLYISGYSYFLPIITRTGTLDPKKDPLAGEGLSFLTAPRFASLRMVATNQLSFANFLTT